MLLLESYSQYVSFIVPMYMSSSARQSVEDVSASYDALVDLFESIESFLGRLDIYTRIPITTAMTHIITKIMVEVLATLALATRQLKQGRLSECYPR